MVTFDAPDRETCTVRRERTNTPLQALVLLNDPTYVETARGLAERTMHEGGNSDNERITYAFRIVTGRRPTAAESAILLEEFNQRFAAFKTDPQTATRLLSVGDSQVDSNLPTEELAAWTMVARLLFNLDEAITKS